MSKIVLALYDFLLRHKAVYRSLLIGLVAVCALLVWRMDYKEDISDFLPLTDRQKQAMTIYQEISGAERIVLIFEGGDLDAKLDAIDAYALMLQEKDSSLAHCLTTQIDMSHYLGILHWAYLHMPYFLTEEDYARMDSLLSDNNYVDECMAKNMRLLQMPVSSFLHNTISDDPLSLFAPVVSSLQQFQPMSGGFTSFDGYMLSEDERMAFAFLQTPYGANETKNNTALIHMLNGIGTEITQAYPDVTVRLLGAPVIAVENASRIKKDSLIAVSAAIVLILIVLLYCFRRDRASILYILCTIGFGWLFGMAVMSMICHEVSLIVLGIGSVIIGIAVNYPLHILFHQRYTTSVRQTLEEVVSPLVIGNITTVGAFLTLVPLQAVALRDLGIFAAAMLAGTILFSIVFLPQWMHLRPAIRQSAEQTLSEQDAPQPMTKRRRYTVLAVLAVLTAGLFFAGRHISFDADISHINYMTPQQRADFAYFSALAGETETETVYLVEPYGQISTPASLAAHEGVRTVLSVYRWLPDEQEQRRRLQLWSSFREKHRTALVSALTSKAPRYGFRPESFAPFVQTLSSQPEPMDFASFAPIAQSMLKGYYIEEGAQRALVTRIGVHKDQVNRFEQQVENSLGEQSLLFDIRSLNQSIANKLSDNFDYIGWACSLLVFFFLWISMRSWRAAVVSFLPMAISWIWILGFMHLLGIQFNIVNIILATFIFGQGDDYTIFVVEGLQHEHQTGKRMLPQFRNSIILSAVIMFLGIGVLIIAQHPAMHSLGTVTLIGMSVVILIANIVPPLLRELLFGNTKKH